MSSNKPDILNITEVARTRYFRVESVDLKFSNGEERTYERLSNRNQGAVLLIAFTDDDTFLMIREYAVGVEGYELTLPKGKIDPGEDILTAANRELIEETGFSAKRLTHLHSLSLASGYSTHFTHIVLAEHLIPAEADGDEPEPLEIVPWKFSNIHSLLNQSDCTEARTFAALFICQQHLKARQND